MTLDAWSAGDAPLLAHAVRDFARQQPWLDGDRAAMFFQHVVRSLPVDMRAPDPFITFGRHPGKSDGMVNLLLGNYLLAGIYRSNRGDVTLVTIDEYAPGVTDIFKSCPAPVYLSHFPVDQVERANDWAAWENFRSGCERLQLWGAQTRLQTRGRDKKVPLHSLLRGAAPPPLQQQ